MLPFRNRLFFKKGALSLELERILFAEKKEKLKPEGSFRTGFKTAPTFKAIWQRLSFVDFKLQGADFIAFFTLDTFFPVKLQGVLFTSKKALGCAHWAESTPGSGPKITSKKDCNRRGYKTHADQNQTNFIKCVKLAYNA